MKCKNPNCKSRKEHLERLIKEFEWKVQDIEKEHLESGKTGEPFMLDFFKLQLNLLKEDNPENRFLEPGQLEGCQEVPHWGWWPPGAKSYP